jgi:hypothetical protein
MVTLVYPIAMPMAPQVVAIGGNVSRQWCHVMAMWWSGSLFKGNVANGDQWWPLVAIGDNADNGG